MNTILTRLFVTVMAFFLIINKGMAQNAPTKTADSLFAVADWKNAKTAYEAVLKDTTQNPLAWNRLGFSNYHLKNYTAALKNFQQALLQHPPQGLKPFVFSRMAKIHAIENEKEKAFTELDSAVNNGYANFKELDTLIDFQAIRGGERFKKIRAQVYANANPCMADAHHREFDFWVGEWDVYQTAGKLPAGAHSSIQMISGGCAILENWESPNSNGKSINFIDPVTNKWKQSWAGNYANGTQEFVNGEYKDGAMRFEFTTTGPQGQQVTGHLIFYNQGPNQVRQFNETSADGGKTWTTNYDFTYVRKQ